MGVGGLLPGQWAGRWTAKGARQDVAEREAHKRGSRADGQYREPVPNVSPRGCANCASHEADDATPPDDGREAGNHDDPCRAGHRTKASTHSPMMFTPGTKKASDQARLKPALPRISATGATKITRLTTKNTSQCQILKEPISTPLWSAVDSGQPVAR